MQEEERDLIQEYHGDRPTTRATAEYNQRDAKARAEAWDKGVRDTSNHAVVILSTKNVSFYTVRGLSGYVVEADVTDDRDVTIRRARFTKGRDTDLQDGEVVVASTTEFDPKYIEQRHQTVLTSYLKKLSQICGKEVDGSRFRDITVSPGPEQNVIRETLKEIGKSDKLFDDPKDGGTVSAENHARAVLSSINFLGLGG